MKPENAIEVNNITKSFKVYFDKGDTIKEKLLFWSRSRYENRQVLRGISFDVKKGEAVGLIGHNGCGKSTTLKLLTKIMYPDSGTIEMRGRVCSLIELGAGFHPDMSGLENIYINASIFGLNKAEIDRRLDDIIAFSELEEYIHNPVRTYSSGMYMRLAFSVAINVDADILLVDEILAVGDTAFQAKCFNRLREIKAAGTTIVIVSHSLGQIEQICERSIWIHDGLIRAEGAPRDIHPMYLDYMGSKNDELSHSEDNPQEESAVNESDSSEETSEAALMEQAGIADVQEESRKRWGNGDAQIKKIRLLDKNGEEKSRFRTGDPMTIEINYKIYRELHNSVFGIGIFRNDGLQCYGTNTQIEHYQNMEVGKVGKVSFKISDNVLLPGVYMLDLAIHSEDGFAYDYYRYAKTFTMYSDVQDVGIGRLNHVWEFTPENDR